MNLLQIFSDKVSLDLALAMAGLPEGSPERGAMLSQAGLGAGAAEAFEKVAGVFGALRTAAPAAREHACLDDNTLAEYVDGVLTASELAVVERRLVECPSCLRHAVSLAQVTHELNPPTPLRQVVLGIARKGLRFLTAPLEGFSELTVQPVAMLSSATEVAARRWRMEDGDISGIFTLMLEEGGSVGLTAAFEREGEAVTLGRLGLRLADSLLEAHPLNDGQHTFWHLEPGEYTVELTLGGAETASFPLVIEATE